MCLGGHREWISLTVDCDESPSSLTASRIKSNDRVLLPARTIRLGGENYMAYPLRSRTALYAFRCALALALLLPLNSALSGQATTAAPTVEILTGELQSAATVLDIGRRFERENRWLDALSHYEEAVRQYPSDETIKLRHTLAQIHCDLDRRLADRSFHDLIGDITQTDALEIYNELGLKIYNHYYKPPDWQRLTWRGTANLDVAITKTDFRQRYLPRATKGQIDAFRTSLRDDVNRRPVRTQSEALSLANYTSQLASRHLGLNPAAAVMEYCCGAISALDQYSTYLTSAQLDDVYNQIEGNFVGLGVELKADNNELLIVDVIKDGPAYRSGVKKGDRIVAVDGRATSEISTDTAADMLKGEQGSLVTITLMRASGQRASVQVIRDRVEVPCVEQVSILDKERGIGYFRLTSFQKTTSGDVDAALWNLHRRGMKSLIIDVRGNPGGLLTASVEVADKFLYEGTIVATRGRNTHEDYDYKAHRVGTWGIPLIVLIDEETASASEIFSGAIRDQGRGTVLGETSYGKGSVQGIFPLSSHRSGIRLTTARFFTPKGHPISGRGVIPHQSIPDQLTRVKPSIAAVAVDADGRFDPVLATAIDLSARQLNVAASR